MKEHLTAREVGRLIGHTSQTVLNRFSEGRLPAPCRIEPGPMVWHIQDIRAYLEDVEQVQRSLQCVQRAMLGPVAYEYHRLGILAVAMLTQQRLYVGTRRKLWDDHLADVPWDQLAGRRIDDEEAQAVEARRNALSNAYWPIVPRTG